MSKRSRTIYLATPSRLRHMREVIKSFARQRGYIVPFHPGDICPYEEFEENPAFGRARTLALLRDFQEQFDVLAVCGVSEGVLLELNHALELNQEIITFPDFDSRWEIENEALKARYGDPLARLRQRNGRVIVLVGTRAVGKTYWINRLLSEFSGKLQRIKTSTTRPARDLADYESYNFLSADDFLRKKGAHDFLESTEYRGHYYGSSLSVIRSTVYGGINGIFALTPEGLPPLWKYRHEFDISVILFRSASPQVLLENMKERGITDPAVVNDVLRNEEKYVIPSGIPYNKVILTRDKHESDRIAVLEAIGNL